MALSLKAILGLDGSGFELGIKRAESVAKKFATNTRKGINERLSGFLTAAFVEEAIRKTVGYAGEINDLSQRLEVSTDAIQQWEFAAKQAGGTAENVATFFEKLAETREKALRGDKDSIKNLKNLGVSRQDLQSLRLEDVGLKVGNAIQSGDAQALVASLKAVGGKGSVALIAAMKEGLSEQFAKAPLIKTEEILRLDALGDEVETLAKKLMAGFAPVITFFGNGLLGIFDKFEKKVASVAAFVGAFSQDEFKLTDLINPFDMIDRVEKGIRAAQSAVEEINKQKESRDEATKSQIEAAKSRGGGLASVISKDLPSDKIFSHTADKIGLGSANLNSLQQIGAAVGFNPVLTQLQKNQSALDKNTAAIEKQNQLDIQNYKRNRYVTGMDGGSQADGRVTF